MISLQLLIIYEIFPDRNKFLLHFIVSVKTAHKKDGGESR